MCLERRHSQPRRLRPDRNTLPIHDQTMLISSPTNSATTAPRNCGTATMDPHPTGGKREGTPSVGGEKRRPEITSEEFRLRLANLGCTQRRFAEQAGYPSGRSGRSYEEANSGQRSAKLFSPQTTSGDRHARIPLFRSAVRCSRRSRRHLRLDGTESVEMVDHLTVAGKR